MLMDVETLFLNTHQVHLRILAAELYPLTLFLSSPPSLWDAAVVFPPDLLVETLAHMYPSPPYGHTLFLPHTGKILS